MEERKTISEIGECVIAEMQRMQYAPLTMEYFRYDVRRLADFVRQRTGEEFFSEELGRIYLADTIGYGDTSHEVEITVTDEEWEKIREALPDTAAPPARDPLAPAYDVGDKVYLEDTEYIIEDSSYCY